MKQFETNFLKCEKKSKHVTKVNVYEDIVNPTKQFKSKYKQLFPNKIIEEEYFKTSHIYRITYGYYYYILPKGRSIYEMAIKNEEDEVIINKIHVKNYDNKLSKDVWRTDNAILLSFCIFRKAAESSKSILSKEMFFPETSECFWLFYFHFLFVNGKIHNVENNNNIQSMVKSITYNYNAWFKIFEKHKRTEITGKINIRDGFIKTSKLIEDFIVDSYPIICSPKRINENIIYKNKYIYKQYFTNKIIEDEYFKTSHIYRITYGYYYYILPKCRSIYEMAINNEDEDAIINKIHVKEYDSKLSEYDYKMDNFILLSFFKFRKSKSSLYKSVFFSKKVEQFVLLYFNFLYVVKNKYNLQYNVKSITYNYCAWFKLFVKFKKSDNKYSLEEKYKRIEDFIVDSYPVMCNTKHLKKFENLII